MLKKSLGNRWKKILGYLAFALFSLYVGFALTFPYDALQKRAEYEAGKAGYVLKIKSMWFDWSLRARGVTIQSKTTDGLSVDANRPMEINSVSIRPQLFPLGLRASAHFWDGDLGVSMSQMSTLELGFNVFDIDLSHRNVKEFLGADLTGRWNGEGNVSVPLVKLGSQGAVSDWSRANGTLELTSKGLGTQGGSIMSFDLPKTNLGDLNAKLKIEKGLTTISALELKGDGFEMKTTGTIKLAQRASNSELNVELRVKASKDFSNALGPYSLALSQLREVPNERDWRYMKFNGILSNNALLSGFTGGR